MTTPRTSFFDSGNERLDPIRPIRVRIISLGDVGTGKSCLIKRYCEPSRFLPKSVPTIGVDYGARACRVRKGGGQLEAKIDFFDLSGEGRKVNGDRSPAPRHPLPR
jgi:GTPase SAR1 family protein